MGLNRRIVSWMDEHLYPGTEPRWDDSAFRRLVLSRLERDHTVLDVGAGAGIIALTDYREHAGRVCGIDPSERVLTNPHLHEARVAFADRIPYDENTFDAAVASNVLEHLENPEVAFAEIRRVLKPGGVFMAKTPNLNHYMALIARLTPHRLHEFIISRIFTRRAEDTFPTRYRANTKRAIARAATRAGLEVEAVAFLEARPEYLRFSFPTYAAGWLYERAVNRIPGMARFRIVMLVTLRKKAANK